MKKILIVAASLFALSACKNEKSETQSSVNQDSTLAPKALGNGKFAFNFNDIYFVIDSTVGARPIELTIQKTPLLTSSTINKDNYGNTFWPSPQSIWGWPPLATIDSKPYSGGIVGNTLSFTSAKDSMTGLILNKEYSINPEKNYITLKYTMENQSGKDQKVAPWEITRMYPGGLTIYPSGDAAKTGDLAKLTKDTIGHTWFQYNANTIPSGVPKLFSDGKQGWLAQTTGDILFVKTFPDVPVNEISPAEGEIELYTNPDKSYIEVEQQGSYLNLANGTKRTWEVRWYLRKIPTTIEVKTGSKSLVDFINETLK